MITITQDPALDRLVSFEQDSWPLEEQATTGQLSARKEQFGEGIFLLSDNGKDVAQFTLAPKSFSLESIEGFVQMRDVPVDYGSRSLWGINLACPAKYQGKGYSIRLVVHAFRWATDVGYESFTAGLTLYGLSRKIAQGKVKDAQDFHRKGMNCVVKVFRRSAAILNAQFSCGEPIAEYWPEDLDSLGYGVVVSIVFKEGVLA